MNKKNQVDLVQIELERFQARLDLLENSFYNEYTSKSFAALKRASMDLTRALTELRRS